VSNKSNLEFLPGDIVPTKDEGIYVIFKKNEDGTFSSLRSDSVIDISGNSMKTKEDNIRIFTIEEIETILKSEEYKDLLIGLPLILDFKKINSKIYYPKFSIICESCGNLKFFSACLSGLLPEDKSDEKLVEEQEKDELQDLRPNSSKNIISKFLKWLHDSVSKKEDDSASCENKECK